MKSKEEFLKYFENETQSLSKDNLYVIYMFLDEYHPELRLNTDFILVNERKSDFLFLLNDFLTQEIKEISQYRCGWYLPINYRTFFSTMYGFPVIMNKRQQRQIKEYFQMKTKMTRDYNSLDNYVKIVLSHCVPVKENLINSFNQKIEETVQFMKEEISKKQNERQGKQGSTDDNGGIYGIYENDELVYIGMTMRSFESRWKEHKERIKNGSNELALYSLIDANAKIEFKKLLEVDKMNSNDKITKRDVQAMEFALIQEHRPKYNFAGKSQPYVF